MKTAAPGNILVRMVPAAALAAFLGLAASGETLVWNPEGSGGWGSDTRWQGGGLPDTGDTSADGDDAMSQEDAASGQPSGDLLG